MGTVSKLKSPVKNEIQTFLHCKKCIEELPGDQSPPVGFIEGIST